MEKNTKSFKIKSAGKKGKGVFATRDISKGELILIRDYSKLKRFKVGDKELAKTYHSDYIGDGKYVIDYSPHSFFNHSCEPNTKTVIISKNKAKVYAIKNIKKGEELTHDYSGAKGDFTKAKKEGLHVWEMKCLCGSEKCKGIIRGI